MGSEFPGVVPLAVQGDGNCLLRFCRVRMYVCMYVCITELQQAVCQKAICCSFAIWSKRNSKDWS